MNGEPKELDYFLQKNYSHSLWHFSLSLAENFIFWRDYRSVKKKELGNLRLSWTEFWKKRKKELENLKKKNIEILNEFLNKTETEPEFGAWLIRMELEKRANLSDKDYFEKIFELTPFFKTLNELSEKIDKKLNIQNIRGAPSRRANIVSLIWSYFIKSNNKINLVEIINLLDWFEVQFQNLPPYKFFSEEVSKLHNEKLKKIIHRHQKQNTYKSLIEEGKSIFEEPVGSRIILFEDEKIKIKYLRETDWHKNNYFPPLVIFPNRKKLNVEDFKKNSIKAKVSFKNRAYKCLFK